MCSVSVVAALLVDLLQVSLLSSQDIEEKQGDITRHRAETGRNYRRRERLVGLETPRVMSSQYGGGCQVQWRVPSTVEGYLAVQWGAIMKYSGGCGVRWRAI